MSYLIKKDTKTNKIKYYEYELRGYKFKPKRTPGIDLQIKEVVIVNNNMIDQILSLKIEKKFNKLIDLTMQVIDNDNDDQGETAFVLGEVEKLKAIILTKYQKYVKEKKTKVMLQKLNNLENALKQKMIENQYIYEEQKSRSL